MPARARCASWKGIMSMRDSGQIISTKSTYAKYDVRVSNNRFSLLFFVCILWMIMDDNNNNNTHNINNIIVKDPHISVLFNFRVFKWNENGKVVESRLIPFKMQLVCNSSILPICCHCQWLQFLFTISFIQVDPAHSTTLLTVQIVTRFDHFH